MQYYINNIPVSKSDYESHKQAKKKRKKIIILVASFCTLGLIAYITIVFFTVFSVAGNSNAYIEAKNVIHSNNEILEITGGVEDMRITKANIKTEGFIGVAEFDIAVDGIKNDADVHINLHNIHSRGWEVDEVDIK